MEQLATCHHGMQNLLLWPVQLVTVAALATLCNCDSRLLCSQGWLVNIVSGLAPVALHAVAGYLIRR
jgi:hypothetical protein